MCWAETCCYFIPANLGCVLLGVGSFILSTFLAVASIATYFLLEHKEENGILQIQKPHFVLAMGLHLNKSSVHIILSILIIIAVLWMVFSVLLVIGIVKNKPSYILGYFSFGIIGTILCMLSGLLVLINNLWIFSTILFTFSMLHIHFLVVVHTVYELMQRGKDFRFHQQQAEDIDPLADCFHEGIDRI